MSVTEDVTPEVSQEWWGSSLSIKTSDCILDIKIIGGSEGLGFGNIGNICRGRPWCFSTKTSPVPSIVWVVDFIIVAWPLRRGLFSIILFCSHLMESMEDTTFLGLRGIPSHSRRVLSFFPICSKSELDQVIMTSCATLVLEDCACLMGIDLLNADKESTFELSALSISESILCFNDLVDSLTCFSKSDCLGFI